MARLKAEFAHLHATLARFQAQEEIAPLVRSAGERGDMLRSIFTALRLSNGPMELREITVRTLLALSMDAGDLRVVRVMQERVRTALLRQEKAGVVRAERVGHGKAVRWGLASLA